jgi:hypothetical protein
MILKLTNCADGHQGNPILINFDHIISVYPVRAINKSMTVLYSTTKETWEVSEDVETISKMMEEV